MAEVEWASESIGQVTSGPNKEAGKWQVEEGSPGRGGGKWGESCERGRVCLRVVRSNEVWFVQAYDPNDGTCKSFATGWEDRAEIDVVVCNFNSDATRAREARFKWGSCASRTSIWRTVSL